MTPIDLKRCLAALALVSLATPTRAGPPYLTNDPAPTDTGHWEIYAFATGEAWRSNVDTDAGIELNYGPVKDMQLSAAFPVSFSHTRFEGWSSGTGHVELGVKYRFFNDGRSGISAAVFPKAILPTSSLAHHEKTRFQLPLWVGKDLGGGANLFGGGGYTIHPGPGNKDFWQANVAITQTLNPKVSFGAEIMRQGSDTFGGTAQTRAGVGSTIKLGEHYGLLFSGGPTWANHRTGYHFYAALGIFY